VAKKKRNQALRRFHARGKRALQVGEQRKRRGQGIWGTAASLGAKTDTDQHRLLEARRFARMYSDEDLEVLCNLGQGKGRPITRLQVVQLIRVRDRRKRDALAKRCAENSWSFRRLQFEVDREVPRRQYGGRSQEPPQSVEEALLVTARMAGSLVRWRNVLESDDLTFKNRVTMKKLPVTIAIPLTNLATDAAALCKKVDKWIKKKTSMPCQKRRLSKGASARR
jgi:hypothetical protein